MLKGQKVAFLDRDGVINLDVGYVAKWCDFKFKSGAINGLKRLIKLGYKIIIITNQSGIARQYFSLKEYDNITRNMVQTLLHHNISILDIYMCPHHPQGTHPEYTKACMCRKPKPGMILRAIKEHKINIPKSILIGDKLTDVQAGNLAGISNCYLFWSKYLVDKIFFAPVFNNWHDLIVTLSKER